MCVMTPYLDSGRQWESSRLAKATGRTSGSGEEPRPDRTWETELIMHSCRVATLGEGGTKERK